MASEVRLVAIPLARVRVAESTRKEPGVKVPPFHSKQVWHKPVYHDESRCTEGDNIEPYNRVSGTGGRRKCDHCRRISG